MQELIVSFSPEEVSNFHSLAQVYVSIQNPETKEKWDYQRSVLTILHFQELMLLNMQFPGAQNFPRTTIFKVVKAAQLALEQGVPQSLLPRYPDWGNPCFYNNGRIQSEVELLHEFLAYTLKLQIQDVQNNLIITIILDIILDIIFSLW